MGVRESGWGSSQLCQRNPSPSIWSLSVCLPYHAGGREELRGQGSKMSLSPQHYPALHLAPWGGCVSNSNQNVWTSIFLQENHPASVI